MCSPIYRERKANPVVSLWWGTKSLENGLFSMLFISESLSEGSVWTLFGHGDS